MWEVTFNKNVLKSDLTREHVPNVPYLFTSENLGVIDEYINQSSNKIIKRAIPSRHKNWQYPEEIKTLLIYNSGRLGDQLWTTAVVRKIKKLRPWIEIDVVDGALRDSIWERNKDIRSIKKESVLTTDLLSFYDGVLIYDDIIADLGNEQENCYKVLFDFAGLPFDESDCVPVYKVFRGEVRAVYNKLLTPVAGMLDNLQGHFILGLHSAVDSRNLHVSQWIEIIAALSKAAPHARIYGVSSGETGAMIQTGIMSALEQQKNNIAMLKSDIAKGGDNVMKLEAAKKLLPAQWNPESYIPINDKLDIKWIAALMRRAACVISVDSMLVHLAASQETACVAIFGTHAPEWRVSTYPFCEAINKKEVCPYANCGWKHDKLMDNSRGIDVYADCYIPQRNMCAVNLAVTSKDVIPAVGRALKKRFPTADTVLDESLLSII